MKVRFHYGWVICASCTLLLFCTIGLTVNAFSVYLPYIIKQNGLTNTQGSSIMTVRSIFSIAAMMLTNRYYKKVSIRIGAVIACFIIALSFWVYANAKDLAGFWGAAALAGIAYGLGSMIPVSILINRWFVRRRALAVAICACGTGLATICCPPVLTEIIEKSGIKTAFILEAVFVLLVCIIIFLLIRNQPEDMALKPYGKYDDSMEVQPAGVIQKENQLSGSSNILVLAALMLLGAVAISGSSHLAVYFSSEGFDSRVVALAISVYGLVLTIGKCIYGYVTDRIGVYKSNYLFFGTLSVGLGLCCLVSSGSRELLFASAMLLGLGYPPSTVGISVWASDLSYGNYAVTVKRFQTAYATGGLIGTVLPGILADLTGTYAAAYGVFFIFIIAVLIILQRSYKHILKQ